MKMKRYVSLLVFFLLITGPLSAAENHELVVTTMQVQNLTCSSCLLKIGGRLQPLAGYLGMEADLAKGLIYLRHDPSLDEGGVAALLTVLGYPAIIVAGPGAEEIVVAGTSDGGCGGKGCCSATSGSWKKLIDKIKSK
ncbi:MAG: heavy-metal-associated domain-containing protein [Proteobacteria bacterium]|nr:heavy-metal-associated domain-containing protein [Pseudomonadota bacterium]MBU1715428.1 heavy-metal-associated domain-containing protein [Pseudomonadota bacterium]